MVTRIFSRPKYLKDATFHYCPGCGHSIAHRLVAEVIEELDIGRITIGVPPAGCAVLAYDYFDLDIGEAAHGRGAAVATGIKRVHPDKVVFTYQGDGDIAAIGTAETIHAANRGERISSFFINNGTYGMTGGQMAPTTMLGQSSTTTPGGRTMLRDGAPLNLSQMLGLVDGAVYIERVAVNSPKNIRNAKKAIMKAFKVQIANLGYSMVEILSPCPTNWKMTPVEACKWIDETMTKVFPIKVIKDEVGNI
jgi:2-oxoglutarate/2-oxoacid ferredoxin oxidoreductase subunit beta